ncbi:MAG: OmpA family protein [bacterium]|nr:OmpA family protein [bacterium]
MRRPFPTLPSAALLLATLFAAAAVAATPQERAAAVAATLAQARELGADKRCPDDYRAAEAANDVAVGCVAGGGDCDGTLAAAELAAARALGRIRFIEDLRSARHDWQEAAERYDRLVGRVATVAGLTLDPALTGEAAGRRVLADLDREMTALRVRADSLEAVNRGYGAWVEGGRAAQESTIAELRRELTAARHALWESQLRAGVAEADLSAAASRETLTQDREAAVRSLGQLFSPQEGQVWLTPEGDVRVRLTGLKFASGNAWLNPKYDPLLDKAAEAIRRFPDLVPEVEGHTDDSGPRAANQKLSLARARAVAAALAKRLDAPASSLAATGMGPDSPVAPNTTEDGKARNRRIELVLKAARGGG